MEATTYSHSPDISLGPTYFTSRCRSKAIHPITSKSCACHWRAEFNGLSGSTRNLELPVRACPARLCIYSPTNANVQRFFAFDPNTGLSHEITPARMSANPERPNWSLSPDGSILVTRVLRSDSDAAVRLLSLNDRSQTMIPLPGWPLMAGIDWACDGKSLWIAASNSRTSGPRNCALLNVSTDGAIRVTVQDDDLCLLAGIPSPDDRHLALEGVRPDSSNVCLLENF